MSSVVSTPSPSLKGEWLNIGLLFLLYFLQGIPMGLSASVPMFLGARGASMSDQAKFSMASWPYSLKLLWAPLVDALWTRKYRLGQRKTWVVPVQIVTGVMMISLGSTVSSFIGGDSDNTVDPDVSLNINGLLSFFFVMYVLAATQDIAVDGWALTMLRPENIGYASSINSLAQSIGFQVSFGLFMAFDSADICNRYIRRPLGLPASEYGLVSLAGFLRFWGVIFVVSTLLVWFFTVEKEPPPLELSAESEIVGDMLVDLDGHARPLVHAFSVDSGSENVGQHGLQWEGFMDSSPASILDGVRSHGSRQSHAGYTALASSSSHSHRRTSSRYRRQISLPLEASYLQIDSPSSVSPDSHRHVPHHRRDLTAHKEPLFSGPLLSPGFATHSVRSRPPESDSEKVRNSTELELTSLMRPESTTPSSTAAPQPEQGALASIVSTYRDFWCILSLKPVLQLAFILVTIRGGFIVVDAATSLVLQQQGISKEVQAGLEMAQFLILMCVQVGLSRVLAGPKPLHYLLGAFPIRAVFGPLFVWLAFSFVPKYVQKPIPIDGVTVSATVGYQVLLPILVMNILYSCTVATMFMGQMAFFTRVSSLVPSLGGSYVTLLNTMANLGNLWPAPLSLKAIDYFSKTTCEPSGVNSTEPVLSAPLDENLEGTVCTTKSGYPTVVYIGLGYAIVWYLLFAKKILDLQHLPLQQWKPKLKRDSSPTNNNGNNVNGDNSDASSNMSNVNNSVSNEFSDMEDEEETSLLYLGNSNNKHTGRDRSVRSAGSVVSSGRSNSSGNTKRSKRSSSRKPRSD